MFTDGRDFQVVDHTQADERRSVRTLSGGETFMASLALALSKRHRAAVGFFRDRRPELYGRLVEDI